MYEINKILTFGTPVSASQGLDKDILRPYTRQRESIYIFFFLSFFLSILSRCTKGRGNQVSPVVVRSSVSEYGAL
jgi:hypothetical protein